ncbi:MAG: hypothetical protein RSC41_03350 [Oscillospiraceae bacterium]
MKKLFATLLTATMVAGTAVSAFAAVETKYTAADSTADFTLANVVLNADGKTTTNVNGGDKLYYPILISTDKLDKTGYDAPYYLMNYSSELDGLTARVKNVRNGKYLKDPAIVKKDVAGAYSADVTLTGTAETVTGVTKADEIPEKKGSFKVDFKDVVVGTAAAKDDTVELTIGEKTVTGANLAADATVEDLAKSFNAKKVTIDTIEYTASCTSGKIVTFEDKSGEAVAADYTVPTSATLAPTTSKAITLTTPTVTTTKVQDGVKKVEAVAEKLGTYTSKTISAFTKDAKVTMTFNNKSVTITATGVLNDDLAALVAEYKKVDTTDYEATVAGSAIKFTQKTGKGSPTIPTDFSLKAGVAAADKKVYCVEVALGDYFGNEETELEFEIELRHKGKLEFTTKDADNGPATYFNLGSEATKLVAGSPIGAAADKRGTVKKFRNGDLELKINSKTGSVVLEEATLSDGKTVEDVDYIYLEGEVAPFTYDVKASSQGDLYLSVNEDANKKVVVSNQDAKMTFLNFPGAPEFDFTGTLKYTVEDPDVDYFFYEIVDGKPVKTSAKYNKADECFELRTRTLGSYVISDKELEVAAADDAEKPADKPSTEKPANPTTPDKNVPTGAIA